MSKHAIRVVEPDPRCHLPNSVFIIYSPHVCIAAKACPSMVQGIQGFGGAVRSAHYDIILTDLSDVQSLEKQIETATSKPSIVPIAIKATKVERAAAKKQYKCFIKDSNDGDEYLEVIDAAMKARDRNTQR